MPTPCLELVNITDTHPGSPPNAGVTSASGKQRGYYGRRPGSNPAADTVYPTLPQRTWRTILFGMLSSVTLMLNGESRVFEGPDAGPLSVTALLVSLGLDTRKVAVERNEEIVPRSRYAETWLASGDALEIVHFIGGG